MAQPTISQQVLEDFMATIAKNPNVDRQQLLQAFPEFNNDMGMLDAAFDYRATRMENPMADISTVNAKFPEFFGNETPSSPQTEQTEQQELGFWQKFLRAWNPNTPTYIDRPGEGYPGLGDTTPTELKVSDVVRPLDEQSQSQQTPPAGFRRVDISQPVYNPNTGQREVFIMGEPDEEWRRQLEQKERKRAENLPRYEQMWTQDEKRFNDILAQAEQDANKAAGRVAEEYNRIYSTMGMPGGTRLAMSGEMRAAANQETDPDKIADKMMNEIVARYEKEQEIEIKWQIRQALQTQNPQLSEEDLNTAVNDTYANLKSKPVEQLAQETGVDDSDIAIYAEYVKEQMQKRFLEKYTPHDNWEYFARKVAEGNLLAQVVSRLIETPAQRAYQTQGTQRYAAQNAGAGITALDFAAEATNIVTDPTMYFFPGAGNAVAHGATRLVATRALTRKGIPFAAEVAERQLMQRGSWNAAQRLLGGAIGFAGIDAAHDIAGQLYMPVYNQETGKYENGTIDPMQVFGAAGKGALMGTAFGVGGLMGDAAQRSVSQAYGKTLGAVAGKGTHYASGTTLLFGSDVISQMAQGTPIDDIDFGEAYRHAAMTQLFFDCWGGVKQFNANRNIRLKDGSVVHMPFRDAVRLGWYNTKNPYQERFTFTDEELQQLNKYISGGNNQEIILNLGSKGKQGNDNWLGDFYKQLNNIFSDPEVDTQTKYKLAFILSGEDVRGNVRPIAVGAVEDAGNGQFVVRTMDNSGQTYSTRRFNSQEDALRYQAEQQDAIKTDKMHWLEDVAATYGFAKVFKATMDEVVDKTIENYPQLTREEAMRIFTTKPEELNKYDRSIRNQMEKYLAEDVKGQDYVQYLRQQVASQYGLKEEDINRMLLMDYDALSNSQKEIFNDYMSRLEQEIPLNKEVASQLKALNGTIPADGGTPVEPESLTPAQAERQRITDEVTRDISEHTHSNGYLYPVTEPGNTDKAGFIVGDVVPVIDESNPEKLTISNNEVVTVKWSDGTVTQTAAKDLDLAGVPSLATDAINAEVERRMNEFTGQRIASGENPIMLQDPEGNVQGFFPTDDLAIVEDENGNPFALDQLSQEGWQAIETDAQGNTIIRPIADIIQPIQQEPQVQQPIVEQPVVPVVPNIETMSAEELGGSAVEYMGDRASATAYLEAERDKAEAEVRRVSKLKITRFNGPEDFKRQNDELQSIKKTAADRYNKIQNALVVVNAYKTVAEQQAEAERKAREAAMREQRRQLAEAEAAGDIEARWQNTKKTEGLAGTKTLPNGQTVHGHYILTEAGTVYPSHDPRTNYADSEGYVMENGQNVNDNNYKDPDVQRIALDMAQNYGGQAVEQMPILENKAGRVLSGNNRTISGIIAAENNTDQAYLQALADNAQQYGFTPEQLAEYQHPRLQFVVEDELPFTTGTFAMFNQQEKKTKSSVNRAVANSKMVTEAVRDRMLDIMDQYDSVDSFFGSEGAAADVIQTLINEGMMTQQEVAGLTEATDRGFKFNQSGKEYVTDMLLGTLFDEDTIRMLAGEKTLKQAILRALPSIVENRRLKGYELTESVNQAIKLLYEARKANEGKSTADAFQLYIRQVDAFEGTVADRYNEFDIILARRMSAGVEQLRELLGMYNNSARNEANGQMGFFEPRTRDDIKQDVYEYYTRQDPELAAAINGAATRVEEPQSAVPSGAPNEGETRQEVSKAEYQQQLAKYLQNIKDADHEPYICDYSTMLDAMQAVGASEEEIAEVAYILEQGGGIDGFYKRGYVVLNADELTDNEIARSKYVHERQHDLTHKDIGRVKEVMKATNENDLKAVVANLAGHHLYDDYSYLAVADEFISFGMEEAYKVDTDEELENTLRNAGANDEIINIIKSINNEQRGNQSFALARRHARVNPSSEDRGTEGGGNSETSSPGNVREEGSNANQGSLRGTESGRSDLSEAGGQVIEQPQTINQGNSNDQSRNLTDAAEIETSGALVDQLERMGVEVSTDLAANQEALKKAKKDKSEAGTIHYYKTQSGQQYGFSYKGKVYLDPRKVDANLPLHEYGHLWCDAFRRLNPEGWQSVIETIKADADSWNFIKQLRPELKTDDEIADEVIATFSGKRGSEKLKAELERMADKDPNYKSKWQNIFKNISKAIQDFWKAVGDFLHIQYQSAEQVYDQVLKDFVENMNPRKRIEDFLKERNDAYLRAVEANDSKTATAIFNEALRENIGNGITPYVSVGNYQQLKRLAKGVKTRDPKIIQEAAELIAPLIPENAVLIPAPSHTGRATDILDLANAIASITPAEVADILQSAPRESQYQQKKETGVPMSSKNLGITLNGVVPEGKVPVVIDNVVDSGNTAEACVQALGKGVVVSLANSAPAYGHAATLKSASPVLRDKNGNVIPLDKRFELEGSKYLGRIAPQDIRFAINGMGLVKLDGKTLVGLHNVNEYKLRQIMKAGGLANPSAAVIDLARQDHTDYGEISFVLSSNMVENADATYAGDAWTPMYPHVEYRLGNDTVKKIKKLVEGLPESLAKGIMGRIDDYMQENRRTSGLEVLFLKEKGVDTPILHNERRYPGITIEEVYKRLGMEYPGYYDSSAFQEYEKLSPEQLYDFNNWFEHYGNQEDIDRINNKIADLRAKGEDKAADVLVGRYAKPLFFNYFDSIGYRILRDQKDAGEENIGATLDAADRQIDELGYRDEFQEWQRKVIDSLGYNEVLFAGWTPSGNRRYVANTVENASRLMNKENQTNYLDRQSVNETKAMLMDRMHTLSEIRKHKDLLEPDPEKVREAYEAVSSDWAQLGIDFRDYTTNEDKTAYGLDDNPFTAIDTALARLQEAMFKRDPIAYLNKEYRYSLPADSEFATRLKDLMKRIKALPSRYFETKFRRPVYLNEFAAAVVPNDLSQDMRDGLQKSGLTLFDYDPSEAGSRRDATLKATEADGIRFSINGRKSPVLQTQKSSFTNAKLDPAVAREMADIKGKAIKDGIFMQAPNGKPSRLNERQWLQVRTENFKRWFGDWQNDPQNASKILDENGEPMVVYHGTWNDFTTFDKRRIIATNFGKGFYFISDREKAASYGRNVMPVFLNVRKPLDLTTGDNDAEYNKWYGKKKNPYDGYTFIPTLPGVDYTMVVAPNPNQIKSATENDGSFSEASDDIRFSISNRNNDIFYSNAERAVEGIKQDKATPEQWRAMIEKNGGLKAGEDKWLGLSDWLAQQRPNVELQPNETRSQFLARLGEATKRFTISKQDILDYIQNNKIQIEETHYQEGLSEDQQARLDEFKAEFDEFFANGEEETGSLYYDDYADYAWNQMVEKYGDDFESAFELEKLSTGSWMIQPALDYNDELSGAAAYFLGADTDDKSINNTRLRYTTYGLQNKREIALTVPTIEPWSEHDEVHFGDAGEGRAIAWIRFGETHHTTYDDGKVQAAEDVLVIDEIQSKRHQSGREQGYQEHIDRPGLHVEEYIPSSQNPNIAFARVTDENGILYGQVQRLSDGKYRPHGSNLQPIGWTDYNTEEEAFNIVKKEAETLNEGGVPDAPFEKNWHELAMKRILRFAAENGYDKVAWTTGEQQAKRYDIGDVVENINYKPSDAGHTVDIVLKNGGSDIMLDVDADGRIVDDYGSSEYEGKQLSDVVGKDLAKKILASEKPESLDGDNLRIGGEGMKGFYDDMLPRFMQKYGKKWGATVGTVTMPDLEEGYQTMHSVDITDDMRRSVLEGQPMFSISGRRPTGTIAVQPNETRRQYAARVAETIKDMTPRNTTLDDAIRFSITVNHNSPYLLKKADGSFIDPETGERLGFDHRFMGEGEGNQSHGWGSYFSVNDLRHYASQSLMNGGIGQYFDVEKIDAIDPHGRTRAVEAIENYLRTGIPIDQHLEYEIISYQQAVDKHKAEGRNSVAEEVAKYVKEFEAALAGFKGANRHHYVVEIPDNNGTNYIEEEQTPNKEQVEMICSAIHTEQGKEKVRELCKSGSNGRNLYSWLRSERFGSSEETSKALSEAGFTGIHYDGRRDGECYVIFDENDAKITDHIRFSISGQKTPAQVERELERDGFSDESPIRFSIAYHGTGADFDKFLKSKINTGEGSQAFGWGLYFTDAKEIAEDYAKRQARQPKNATDAYLDDKKLNSVDPQTDLDCVAWVMEMEGLTNMRTMNPTTAYQIMTNQIGIKLQRLREQMKFYEGNGATDMIESSERDMDKYKRAYKYVTSENAVPKIEFRGLRNLYTVSIPNDEGNNYFAWNADIDEKLKGQIIDCIVRRMEQIPDYANHPGYAARTVTDFMKPYHAGGVVYLVGTRWLEREEMSDILSELGYKGIKYNAGTNFSTGVPDGAMNYVIFNDDDIHITDHIRFSIGGERGARAIDRANGNREMLDLMDKAYEMEFAGKDPKVIKAATGWERGLDGKWKFDMPRIKSKKNLNWKLSHTENGYPYRKSRSLDELIEAPELFKAYPDLKDIKVTTATLEGEDGSYNDALGMISLKNGLLERHYSRTDFQKRHPEEAAKYEAALKEADDKVEKLPIEQWNAVYEEVDKRFADYLKRQDEFIHNVEQEDDELSDYVLKVLTHEIQHAIQYREGFAMGSNLTDVKAQNAYKKQQYEKIQRQIKELETKLPAPTEHWTEEHDKISAQIEKLEDDARNIRYNTNVSWPAYTSSAGEVEARNAAKRMDMTPKERRAALLSETEDVPREDQVVLFNDTGIRFSIRKEAAPKKTGIGYKVFYRGKDGKLYPPMVANPNGADTPVGVWLNADAAPVAGESKTGRPQVKAGGKGTQGGSGQLAYRPGWHLGEIPYALQFNRKDENGEKTLFPKDFVWAEVEYAADNNYQKAADSYGVTENGKYRHSYAGLPRIPKDGFYMYRTNPNPETDPWIITGAMKVNRVLTNEEVDDLVRQAGREPQRREGDTNNDIRFAITSTSWQNKNRSEVITEALVKQANNNYGIMQSALKKVTQDLKGIRAAMRMQSDYDRKVVESLLNLYNTLLQENSVWSQYMPDTSRRIATQIVHAIGKQNIREEVNTIMDHMVHAQAKAAQRQWDKLRQTPIDKINISGVVMQGKVALEGQHALKAINDALQNGMAIEQLDDMINQLMDMEDNATDESLKLQYKGQWIGYTIAAQHLERVQHLQEERKQLDLELQAARANKALKPAAREQLVDNIKQSMRDNFMEQAEAYIHSTKDLQDYVTTQEGRAKDFIRQQDANRAKIRSYAQRDLEGVSTNPNRMRTKGSVVRSIWDAFASPIRDLQSLLRLCGLHAPDGEGYLYNHFMRNWMDGADKERLGIVEASKTLDEKIAELTHGKYKTWEEAARKIDDASHNMFTITMLNGLDGKDQPVTEDIPLNAGNALYIYAVNKMNDGRMKLNGMNITEEDVQALADKVREQFGQEILDVVDWVQSEFFSQLRNRYNPTHEALFGAPMDAIENYFPLRINANARQQNEDLSEPDTDAARLLAGTSTGAIKRRTRNSLPLDVRNADFFQEVIRHISQMERWNAFAQWNRDANILFSDINFRNRIKGMKGTIYGEGDKLYNYMKDAFRVAIGTYKPKTDTFSEITLNMAKGVTSAKINFRIFTALKQIASFPAFFTYMQDGVFVQSYLRNWLKPHETMKWAKENLPNFEKRVSKRDMGDMRLMQRSTDWQWNKRILEWSSKYGMFFNVFFDTLTCATGARAVYDSHLADYMKKGYSEEDARNRARQDAEQAFNTSQQSSEGAFMSAVQQDRNLVTAALTVFRTSPIQYTRNFFYHTRNLLRKFGEGKRDEQIAFRMGQYKNDGLNDEQARKAAEKDYNKSLRQDIVGFVVYGALLNILWRLAGQIPYLLLGDDDDKKKHILDDATSGGAWFSPFTGLLGGGIVESALDGNGSVADMFAPEMPFTQDIKRAGQYLSNDKYAEFASQALSVLMQSGTGFDPLTASDMVSRIVTTLDSEEELEAATQALRVSQALLSIPQSQYEQMLIDKVVSGETDEDAALEDYIRYQKIHTAPLTWWLRGEESDEKAEENAEKRFNRLLNERDNLHNPEEEE